MPPVPQGGRRAPIDPAPARSRQPVSYTYGGRTGASLSTGTPEQQQQFGWGQSPSIFGAQDLVRPFSAQFQPNAGIFSPSFPLVPVEAELARLWDFPVGYNFIYTPRSYEPITFEELRTLAYNESLTRMAIETRKDQIEKLDWQIKPRDEKSAPKDAAARIKRLTDMWHRPDGDRPFAAWLRELLEDVLVIDAPTLEVLRNRDGTVRGYDVVDGSTIKVLIDITGRTPEAPAPAYEQVIHGRPWRLFTEDELIYVPRNKRPGHVYGYSPVEQILMFVNIALRRQTTQLQWFTEGNLPQGFMGIPELNSQQVAQLQQHVDSILAGNTAERSKFTMLPYGAKYTAVKAAPLKDDFDEWLARVVMFCFSLPPDAFIRQRARAAAETARQSALEEGLAPLMGWVKRLVDWEIQLRLGHPDLEFAWQDIKQIDPESQSKVETTFVKLGMKTIDEARDVMGLDPLPNGIGAQPFVVAGNQVLMVQDLEEASAQAVAPPPPPMIHPAAGPQALGGANAAPSRVPAPGGGGGSSQSTGHGTSGPASENAVGGRPSSGRGPANERPGAPTPGNARRVPAAGRDMPKVMKGTRRPLFVKRPLLNGIELRDWAKSQGFTSALPPDDMHVTVAYSKRPVDWDAVGDPSGTTVWSTDPSGRSVEALGDDGAVVLKFSHAGLEARHWQFRDAGASWDHPSYQPHVTITYDGAPDDLSKVKPFIGELAFGPEVYGEPKDGWKDDVDERALKRADNHPRAAQARPRPRPGADARGGTSLDREARQLLRRHRAARVEADLRAIGA